MKSPPPPANFEARGGRRTDRHWVAGREALIQRIVEQALTMLDHGLLVATYRQLMA